MTHDWLRLEPDEAIRWETHPRLMRAASGVLASFGIAVAAIVAGVLVDPLAFGILLVAPLPAAYAYLQVVNTRYVVTDRALYRKDGVVGIDVRAVESTRVQNTRSSQGVLGTAFGFGTVEIEVAGGRDLRFADVHGPVDLRRRIERLAGGTDAIPGTVDQWRSVRDELRAIRRALDDHPK